MPVQKKKKSNKMPPLGVWCVCCRPSRRFMQTHIHTLSHPHFRRLRSNILRDGNPTTFPHPLPQPVNVNSSSVLILKSGFIRGRGPRAPPTILKGQLWPRRSAHAGHVQPARLLSSSFMFLPVRPDAAPHSSLPHFSPPHSTSSLHL